MPQTFEPIYNSKSSILILGTTPSPKSRENAFYYGHSQNRFWLLLSLVLKCDQPLSIAAKKEMLLRHHIALWDVLADCDITGASDASIRNPKPNNLNQVLNNAPVKAVLLNGATAYNLYQRFFSTIMLPAIRLPSTSPANAVFSLSDLEEKWHVLLNYL